MGFTRARASRGFGRSEGSATEGAISLSAVPATPSAHLQCHKLASGSVQSSIHRSIRSFAYDLLPLKHRAIGAQVVAVGEAKVVSG